MKKFAQTPFDLGVINVIEKLSNISTSFGPELSEYRFKNDILAVLGIAPQAYTKMLNGLRHVSTKPDRQAEIVKKLREVFFVDPDYIYHYGRHQTMFIKPITVDEDPMDESLRGLTARELRQQVTLLRQRVLELLDMNDQLRADCRRWQEVAMANAQAVANLHPALSLAADDGVEPATGKGSRLAKSAKHPAKPTAYTPKKRRK